MKQLINIGNVVDDGTGDYLRKGGQKINDNFSELYTKLGDGDIPHASGAWKTHTQPVLKPNFGDAWAINTTNNAVSVELPKGSASDYNKTIKLRDVWRSWAAHNVTLKPAQGDTIKGSPIDRELYKDFMDVELVYCAPGRWEYVENKRVDTITTSDLSTVAKEVYIATEGQTDFPNVFGSNTYNIRNVEVYYRGNLLYYGKDLTDDSNYGSIGENGDIVPLDGKSIKLRFPCSAGDTIQIITYMDGIASFRSSYITHTIRVYETGMTTLESIPGEVWVGELANKKEFTNAELGVSKRDLINPNSFELLINGTQMIKAGDADLPSFICEGADGETEETCVLAGGQWVESGEDYSLMFDENSVVTGIKLSKSLDNRDTITIRWFNNDIGTLMEWDGVGGIKEKADKIYLNNEDEVTLTNRIEYTDFQNPSQATKRPMEDYTGRVMDIYSIFDIFYPIGTIYENAHNPANPATYMGFGTWVRYAEKEFLVGWSSDASDQNFALNNNDLDAHGQPTHTAGGNGGDVAYQIKKNMIPELQSDDRVLVKDDNGNIIIGGCQVDPDAVGPAFTKYREDNVKVNQGNTDPSMIGILPPYRTVYRWLRVG